MNSDLKQQLRELYITRAREVEFGTKKVFFRAAVAVFATKLTCSLLLLLGNRYLRSSAEAKGFPKGANSPRPRVGKEILGSSCCVLRRAKDSAQAKTRTPRSKQTEASTIENIDSRLRQHFGRSRLPRRNCWQAYPREIGWFATH
jgi:hypothetical protein